MGLEKKEKERKDKWKGKAGGKWVIYLLPTHQQPWKLESSQVLESSRGLVRSLQVLARADWAFASAFELAGLSHFQAAAPGYDLILDKSPSAFDPSPGIDRTWDKSIASLVIR